MNAKMNTNCSTLYYVQISRVDFSAGVPHKTQFYKIVSETCFRCANIPAGYSKTGNCIRLYQTRVFRVRHALVRQLSTNVGIHFFIQPGC